MFAFKQTGCLCLAKQAGTQTMDAANCGGGEDACASQELERRFVLQGGAEGGRWGLIYSKINL